jgi:ornithine cyclodeaminase/alanine dehydrogenase-like protein (mu-crystallin family)
MRQKMTSTYQLGEQQVRSLLHPMEVIAAIESAFRERFPAIQMPPRQFIRASDGVLLIMSCYDAAAPSAGIKLVNIRHQPQAGEERVHATYLLLDPKTAQPNLTIAANYLTALRTAATSAVATKYLAREEVSTLGIFGTGRLARTHLTVLPLVRNFQRILVCGRNVERSEEFAIEMSKEIGREIAPASANTVAAESEVICACTTSPTPLFDGRKLRPGTHLNLVGAFQPNTREADTLTIKRSRVVVDTYEGAQAEAGDILIPIEEGAIAASHIISDLHELLSGKKQVRRNPNDITVFKSVGCALEDLVTAELLTQAQK